MGVTLVKADGTIVAGNEVFENCEGSGQLNLYNSLQLALIPYFVSWEAANPLFIRYACIKGYMLTEVTAHAPLALSRFEGYPSRYNLGGWRWLQANRAMGAPRYIDTMQWADNLTMKIWVAPTGFPNVTFPGASIPVPIPFSDITPLRTSPVSGQEGYSGHVAADGFSFFLTEGVEMTFAFEWYAEFREFARSGVPLGVYLLNI